MRYICAALIPSLAAFLVAAPSARLLEAQASEQQVLVTVLDGGGSPVRGLGPSDFVVREDGNSREVLRVSPAPEGRQIALLVDTSQAARDAVLDFRKGLIAFIEAMHERNEISIISYGGTPRVLVASTTSVTELRAGVGKVFGFLGRAAYLLDAMAETARGFERQEARRPVIVVLATQGPDYSHLTSRPVLDQLEATGAAVYTVVLMEWINPLQADPIARQQDLWQRQLERNIVLDQGPRESGGRRRDLLVNMGIERAMQELASELRSQHLVVYARPDTLIPPEKIEVGVNRAGRTARGTPLKAS